MSCRSLPHYRPGHGWMLGVALHCTLTSTRPAFRGFTRVRCCSLPPASSPHPLTVSAVAFGSQLPQRTLQGTFTPNRSSMFNAQRSGLRAPQGSAPAEAHHGMPRRHHFQPGQNTKTMSSQEQENRNSKRGHF